jgi:hypothetical protein
MVCDKNFVRTTYKVVQLEANSFLADPVENDFSFYNNSFKGFRLTKVNEKWEFNFESNQNKPAEEVLLQVSNAMERKLKSSL